MATIDILLATYNGARYLPEQLHSLETQTFTDWRLIVRDDGSTDGSLAIVEEWAAGCGAELRVLDDGRKGLGACGNFGALLEASDAPYFALCDQDDVWLPEKLAIMHGCLVEANYRYGAEMPILAYSDLRLVDSYLREIHPSFRKYSGIRSPRPGRMLVHMAIQNVVTGCASMGNAALRQVALPMPDEAIMHDWWLAMVAAGLGKVIEVAEPTILYRQHDHNTLGAKSISLMAATRRFIFNPAASVTHMRLMIGRTQRQAQIFVNRFTGKIEENSIDPIRQYGNLPELSFWERKLLIFRSQLWPRV